MANSLLSFVNTLKNMLIDPPTCYQPAKEGGNDMKTEKQKSKKKRLQMVKRRQIRRNRTVGAQGVLLFFLGVSSYAMTRFAEQPIKPRPIELA